LLSAPIALLNTAIDSNNDGDGIITASIQRELPSLAGLESVPTHRLPTPAELKIAHEASALVFTGTNVLSSDLGKNRQWPLTAELLEAYAGKVVFLGVGWRDYEAVEATAGAGAIRALVHPALPVAARDQYTQERLNRLGIPAVNTGCPTMWSLPNTLETPPRNRSAVFTLTDYRPDRSLDNRIIWSVARQYDSVVIWPQSEKDEAYMRKMLLPRNTRRGARGLSALDSLLLSRDYVGTRLHAGIRAAQLGRPSLIIGVDNRAIEISRDTGLPVVPRDRGPRAISRALSTLREVTLSLPHPEIAAWRAAFRQLELALMAGEKGK